MTFEELIVSGLYAQLMSGEVPPREDDFIGSRTDSWVCGFVVDILRLPQSDLAVYTIQLASGKTTIILSNDVRMITPREVD